MQILPSHSSDQQLLEIVHEWVRLLEADKYGEAFSLIAPMPDTGWTPDFLKEFVAGYGDEEPGKHVTLEGKSTDISQRIKVTRWAQNSSSEIGEVWYDLNINGFATDITATFSIFVVSDGMVLKLNDVHVM